MLDINILRVALETAQKCTHNQLVLTEVNPEQAKVTLFQVYVVVVAIVNIHEINSGQHGVWI